MLKQKHLFAFKMMRILTEYNLGELLMCVPQS